MLELARVVGINPQDHSLDVVVLRSGQRAAGVPLAVPGAASTKSGRSDIPLITAKQGDEKWRPDPRTDRDSIVILAPTAGGNWIALGSLFPQENAVLSPTPGVAVYRHHSGAWHMIAPDGTMTIGHPSGAVICLGPGGAAPPNPVGQDVDGLWKHDQPHASSPAALTLTMPSGAGITIATDGKVQITAPAEVKVAAPKLIATGDVQVTGKVTAANVEVTGDVKAGAIGLKTHKHPAHNAVAVP